MKAITVRQPWAWAIVHGGKDVENRSRDFTGAYRGPVAIHAGATWAPEAFDDPILGPLLADRWHMTRGNYRGADLPTRALVGVVDLVDVHHADDCWVRRHAPARTAAIPDTGAGGLIGRIRFCSPWAMPDRHHLTLVNPRPLTEPIPWTGRLGLWNLPDTALGGGGA